MDPQKPWGNSKGISQDFDSHFLNMPSLLVAFKVQ